MSQTKHVVLPSLADEVWTKHVGLPSLADGLLPSLAKGVPSLANGLLPLVSRRGAILSRWTFALMVWTKHVAEVWIKHVTGLPSLAMGFEPKRSRFGTKSICQICGRWLS